MAPTINQVLGVAARTAPQSDGKWALPSEFIGIEIEVENFEGRYEDLLPYWAAVNDASLRDGVEFVLADPLAGRDLTAAINTFFASTHTYSDGPRTSTHIHINASDHVSMEQFRSWLSLVYLIEPAIFRWADEDRKWCGYCSPLTDIGSRRFASVLTASDVAELADNLRGSGNHDRYFGCNFASLSRHGTMEFRYFPWAVAQSQLESWVQWAMECKRAGIGHAGVGALLDAMGDSPAAVMSWLESSFPSSFPHIRDNLDVDELLDRANELRSLVSGPPQFREATGYAGISPAMTRLLSRKWDAGNIANPTPQDIAALRHILMWYSHTGRNREELYQWVRQWLANPQVRTDYTSWAALNPTLDVSGHTLIDVDASIDFANNSIVTGNITLWSDTPSHDSFY